MEVKYELSVANILALMRIRLQRSRGLRNPVIFPRLAYLMGFSLMALGTWLVANQVILLVVFIALAVSYFFPNDSTIIVVKEQIANDEFISFFEVYGENISAAEHRVQRTVGMLAQESAFCNQVEVRSCSSPVRPPPLTHTVRQWWL